MLDIIFQKRERIWREVEGSIYYEIEKKEEERNEK